MGKIKQIKFLEDDLQDHPAFLAWNKIHPGSAIPKRIEIFKGRLANQNREFKRFVCKLEGVGKDGASVIGKCCLPAQAETAPVEPGGEAVQIRTHRHRSDPAVWGGL